MVVLAVVIVESVDEVEVEMDVDVDKAVCGESMMLHRNWNSSIAVSAKPWAFL